MAEMVDAVHTHTHTHGNLVNTNTQYICVFNNDTKIIVLAGLVPAHNDKKDR